MQYSQANEIVNRWHEAAEDLGGSTDNYAFLRKSLGALLSDDAQAGIGFQADAPVVIALDGERLVCVVVNQPAGDDDPTASATSLSVASTPRLDVEVAVSPMLRRACLVKTWTLWEANTKALTVTTLSPINSDFGTDYGGEEVMTTVAQRLGWPIPG